MLISQAFDRYCRLELLASGKSAKTVESYQNAKKLLINFFGDLDVKNIKEEECLLFFEHLSGWQKLDTVRGNMICLRQVLRSLSHLELELINTDSIKIPKRQKRSIKFLTKPDVEDFAKKVLLKSKGYSDIARKRNYAIVMLLFSSGIRVSELCGLNRDSIQNRVFTVIGKSKDPRICFINKKTEIAIMDYLNCRDDNHNALFLSLYGNRISPNNVRSIFFRICSQTNYSKVTPHTLRHSFATYLLDQNVHISYISDFLGHQSLDTTKMYTHVNLQKLQHVYDKSMI